MDAVERMFGRSNVRSKFMKMASSASSHSRR